MARSEWGRTPTCNACWRWTWLEMFMVQGRDVGRALPAPLQTWNGHRSRSQEPLPGLSPAPTSCDSPSLSLSFLFCKWALSLDNLWSTFGCQMPGFNVQMCGGVGKDHASSPLDTCLWIEETAPVGHFWTLFTPWLTPHLCEVGTYLVGNFRGNV